MPKIHYAVSLKSKKIHQPCFIKRKEITGDSLALQELNYNLSCWNIQAQGYEEHQKRRTK